MLLNFVKVDKRFSSVLFFGHFLFLIVILFFTSFNGIGQATELEIHSHPKKRNNIVLDDFRKNIELQQEYREQVQKIIEVAGMQPGMNIGDVGAGVGRFTIPLAEILGNDSKIYANDILEEVLDKIEQIAEEKGIKNIEIVLGDIEDPLFPVNNLDMILMTNVIHDLEKPLTILENLKKYIKHDGKLVIMEPHPSEDKLPLHQMSVEQFLALFERSSYELEKSDTSLRNIYVFRISKEKEKNVWKNWLKNFKDGINEAKNMEEDKNIPEIKKQLVWERLLFNYHDNNPETEEDERLKNLIKEKINYWNVESLSLLDQDQIQEENKSTIKKRRIEIRSEYQMIDREEILSRKKELLSRIDTVNELEDSKNKLYLKSINGDKVIIDKTTGLMWRNETSQKAMDYFNALEWIYNMNRKKYAGYSDWRLPTAEEGYSIANEIISDNSVIKKNLTLNSRGNFWSGDLFVPNKVWVIEYTHKYIFTTEVMKNNHSYVMPVRTVK